MVIEGAGETKGTNVHFQSILQESKIDGNTTGEMGTDPSCGYTEVTEGPQQSGPTDKDGPAEKLSQLLGDKDKEWTATVEKQRPLRLLDLPVDVLKEIIKEVRFIHDLLLDHVLINIGHTYERSNFSRPDPLCSTQSGHSMHIFSIRYCLAGDADDFRAADRSRCADLWFVDLGYVTGYSCRNYSNLPILLLQPLREAEQVPNGWVAPRRARIS